MMSELKRTFKPEFLNRVDEIVLFAPLEHDQTLAIAKLMLKSVAARLKERNIELIVTDDAARLISSEGFDPEYGARPRFTIRLNINGTHLLSLTSIWAAHNCPYMNFTILSAFCNIFVML